MNNTGRLAVCGGLLCALTAYMAYLGASDSWQYYLTADECLSQQSQLTGSRLRVAGKVATGTLRRSAESRNVTFALQAQRAALPVVCTQPPPDNLAEDRDVVVEGFLDEVGTLRGEKVLTRCASKYEARDATQLTSHQPGGPRR